MGLFDDITHLFDDYKRVVEQNFNQPVEDFRRETKRLDENHYNYIQNFKNIMNSLFDPSVPFSGPAADALATVVGNYVRGEDALTDTPRKDDPSDHISELLDNTARLCEQTVAHIRDDLHKLPNGGPVLLEQGGLVLMGEKITPELLFRTGVPALLASITIVSLQEQFIMDDISNSRDQWENGMLQQGFAALAEPKLPPSPNDPNKILYPPQPPIPQNNLTPAQKRLMDDVISRLGNTPVNDAEIEALISAGYTDPDAIAAIVSGKVTVTGTFDSMREQQDAVKFALRMGGGNVHGPRKKNQGIDFIFTPKGSNDQIPVSLKNWSKTGRMENMLQKINHNADKIKSAGYKNAVLNADVPQWTSEDILNFVQNGPIEHMPSEGVFKTLYFNCSDGTVVVDADGARIER